MYLIYWFRAIYNLSIFRRIRKSFIYNFVVVFLLILGILWLQFTMLPHNGYIKTLEKLIMYDSDIFAKSIEINTQYLDLSFTTDDDLYLTFIEANLTMDGYEYSGTFLVKIPKERTYLFDMIINASEKAKLVAGALGGDMHFMSGGIDNIATIADIRFLSIDSVSSIKLLCENCEADFYQADYTRAFCLSILTIVSIAFMYSNALRALSTGVG